MCCLGGPANEARVGTCDETMLIVTDCKYLLWLSQKYFSLSSPRPGNENLSARLLVSLRGKYFTLFVLQLLTQIFL